MITTTNNNNNNNSENEFVSEYVMNFDGCCKGNPGPGGSGAVLYQNGVEIWADSVFVGDRVTNNGAEYLGLIMGLIEATALHIDHILVKGDSQLVINQMKGDFQVNSHNLKYLYAEAKKLESNFLKVNYQHVYRNENTRADILSNEGLLKKPA